MFLITLLYYNIFYFAAKVQQIFHMSKIFWQKNVFFRDFLVFAHSIYQKHACMELTSWFVQKEGTCP